MKINKKIKLVKKNISRRDFVYNVLLLTLTGSFIFDKVLEKQAKNLVRHQQDLVQRIYHELPKHIYLSESTAQTEWGLKEGSCNGIVVNGHYITMEHGIPAAEPEFKETRLFGKKLEEKVVDSENDVAIFNLPDDLKLPDFPAKPSTKYQLGDEVYLIGDPNLTGSNIRKGYISDMDGLNGKYAYMTDGCFGIDMPIIPGDSGCPVVNSNFELVGLARTKFHSLGYVNRIEQYLKHM